MFELSKEHEDFRKVVREFAEAEVEPHIAKWDKDHHFPSDLVPKMGELGLFGLVVGPRAGERDVDRVRTGRRVLHRDRGALVDGGHGDDDAEHRGHKRLLNVRKR